MLAISATPDLSTGAGRARSLDAAPSTPVEERQVDQDYARMTRLVPEYEKTLASYREQADLIAN